MDTLLCWVRGEGAKAVFRVTISREAGVEDLKESLKLKKSTALRDVDAADLELYPLFVPSNANRTAELKKWRAHGKEPLDVEKTVDEVFPNRRDGKWIVVVNYPSFLCWIRGDDVNHVFPVKISREAVVEDLKDTLKLKRSTTLRDVDAANLDLYGLLIPSDGNPAVELGKWRLGDKKPLDVKQKLSNAFPRSEEGEWIVIVTHPSFLCWVWGDRVDNVFEVEISREASVGNLKTTLKRDNPDTFKGVDAKNLELYPLFVPSNGNRAAELGKWRLGDKKPLDVKQKLSNAFPRTQEGEWVVVVNHPTATTKFHVYFKNQTLLVSSVAHDMVKDFLSNLLRDQQHRKLFKDVSASQLNPYRLIPPVLVTEEKKIMEHLELMKHTDIVEKSFGETTVTPQHVCMALMLAEDESSKAIEALKQNHPEIFSCLKITVQTASRWTLGDVKSNLGGGRYTEHDEITVAEIRKIQELLCSRRIYNNAFRRGTPQEVCDFETARKIDNELFEQIFMGISENRDGGLMVRNSREFSTFYHVLRCYHEDASKLRDQKSSAVKAGNFAAYFIQPPFLSPDNPDIKYETEMPWGFPIFIDFNTDVDGCRKYTPKSDLMVSSACHLIPFFVSEVISLKNQEDRFRMLLQAIAVARAGKRFLKSTSKRQFFVVAVYLDKKMVASRYIVMQTGRDRDGPAGVHQVSIHRDDFDLTDKTKAIEFVREMYNLVEELNNLVEDLDKNKSQTLKQIVAASKDVLSLHSRNHPVTRTRGTPLGTIHEERDLGIFGATDVQEHLRSMKCAIDFRVSGHENIAVVKCETGERVGYLKFIEPSRQQEVEILQFLGDLQSPMNHTISGAQFWSVNGGTMISMPIAGDRLTSLECPDEHLWSVASQLIEGVAFMHAQLVAHMDIKPENIVIPRKGGRLSIIDFSIAIRLKSGKEKFRGVIGTPGYTAPEVERGDAYKPIQADLWSCGRTLEVLCSDCKPSFDRNFLLGVAAELMNEDPDQRPTMSRVQEWIASKKVTLSAEKHGFRYPSQLVACA